MKCSVVVSCMIQLHTTIYKPYAKYYAQDQGQSGRERVGVEIWPCAGRGGVFRGRRHPYPYSRRFRVSWALLRGPGRGSGPSSSEMAMLASSAAWLLVLFLGVQPAAFQLAQAVEVGHGLGKPLFPAKPLLTTFQRPRCWMWAQAVELAPARRAAPGRCLAVGQPFLSGHRPR